MSDKIEWYLPDPNGGPGTLGPFRHDEIVEKVKARALTLDSYVWGPHFTNDQWVRLSDVPEFAPLMARYPRCQAPKKWGKGTAAPKANTIDYSKAKGEYGTENEFRRFPRAPLSCEVIVHNQKTLIRCKAVDISEKGLSIETQDNAKFTAGEEIVITLMDSSFAGTISVKATVMRSLDRPFRGYGLYFLTIHPLIKRKIAQYIITTLGGPVRERGAV